MKGGSAVGEFGRILVVLHHPVAVGRVTPPETRREYFPVGSEPASLLATVSAGITHPTTSVTWILIEKSSCV